LFPKSEQIRPASPSKFGMNAALSSPRGTSIARGLSPSREVVPPRGVSPSDRMSPLRVRSSLSKNTPLIPHFAVDGKEKIRDNGVADAHLLRLLHSRLLQWQFANARANAVISSQKMREEVRPFLPECFRILIIDSTTAIGCRNLSVSVKTISYVHLCCVENSNLFMLVQACLCPSDYIFHCREDCTMHGEVSLICIILSA
jgi:hypothetical protein